MTAAGRRGRRRDELIAVAADLLRNGGPDALTSVAVAARCGISQPAVYRHVESMDELTGLASGVIVGELHGVVTEMISAPDVRFDDVDDVLPLMNSIVDAMWVHRRAFDVVDRWRFADGVLGDGIRSVMADGRAVIQLALDLRWREESGHGGDIGEDGHRLQATHAELIHDDAHAVARLVGHPVWPLDRDNAVRVLSTRLFACWTAYTFDMNRLVTGRQLGGAAAGN